MCMFCERIATTFNPILSPSQDPASPTLPRTLSVCQFFYTDLLQRSRIFKITCTSLLEPALRKCSDDADFSSLQSQLLVIPPTTLLRLRNLCLVTNANIGIASCSAIQGGMARELSHRRYLKTSPSKQCVSTSFPLPSYFLA